MTYGNITLGRERADLSAPAPGRYDGPADGAVSALIETGLRAALAGDDAHADAQVFALPEAARAEYREMLQRARTQRAAR